MLLCDTNLSDRCLRQSVNITNVLGDQRQVLIRLVTCIEEVYVRKMEGEML